MNEIKTSIQSIQDCQTIGDLMDRTGRMQEMNQNGSITFTIVPIQEKRSNFAEDLIDDLNSCGGDNPSSFLK